MRFGPALLACLLGLLARGQQPFLHLERSDLRPLPPIHLDQALLTPIPPGWDYSKLGVFCKLDVQLERHFGLPVFIRLGDVQRVEQWEGKGAYRSLIR